MTETVKILFLGDLVGRPARTLVKKFLGGQIAVDGDNDFDFVIGNVKLCQFCAERQESYIGDLVF